jgi:hypothetical protein
MTKARAKCADATAGHTGVNISEPIPLRAGLGAPWRHSVFHTFRQ